MKKTKVIILGGFLGAGKTTLMVSAAEYLRSLGMKVACITNDQGSQLVDSKMVLKNEIPLQQVQGGCFCCKFDNLVDSINTIIIEKQPDIIIAEAVGSCTDLVATVIKPLKAYHGEELEIRPLSVVLDPQRFTSIYANNGAQLSYEVSYLFQKQIEEAQCVVINKNDLMSEDEIKVMIDQLNKDIPNSIKISVSAVTLQGVSSWLEFILFGKDSQENVLDIDYDIYAKGEEQLGWLNASIGIQGGIVDVMELSKSVMNKMIKQFKQRNVEVAHLKLWTECNEDYIKISSVSSNGIIKIDSKLNNGLWNSDNIEIWVNARININFLELKKVLDRTLDKISEEYSLELVVKQMDCFAPSRPVPTYRMS